MSTRRFEMTEGGSSKFWEVSTEGNAYTVRYGRIGTDGQTQRKEFADEAKTHAAVTKLIAEKTGKGYVEVGAPAAAPASAGEVVAPAAEPAAPAATRAKRAPAAKADAPAKEPAKKKDAPPSLTLSNGDTLGPRALANAAERFAAAATREQWTEACYKLKDSERTLVHLLAHDLFTPKSRLHVNALAHPLRTADPAVALKVLVGLDEALVSASNHDISSLQAYGPLLFRLHARAPEALRAAALPPTFAAMAAFVRAFAGEELDAPTRARAFAVAALLAPSGVHHYDERDQMAAVDPEALAEALARCGGPHWIRDIPQSSSLPWQTAIRGLRDEPLEQVARALGYATPRLLAAREDPAARFFEVADAVPLYEGLTAALRIRGISRAASPDEIPAGLEDRIEPRFVRDSNNLWFAGLGTPRLDAWASRWRAEAERRDREDAEAVRDALFALGLRPLPFSDATRMQLIGVPRPYPTNPGYIDVRSYGGCFGNLAPEVAPDLLRIGLGAVREHEAAGARPEIVQGLRLLVAGAVASMPEGAAIDPAADDRISLGDAIDHATEALLVRTIRRLPPERAEAVVARTAHELDDPYRELSFVRAGVSAAGVRRSARLVVGGRHDESMWLRIRQGQLAALGEALGPAIVEAFGDEAPSDSFMTRFERLADAQAVAYVRANVKPPLDLQAEMNQIAAEIGGETIAIYVLRPGGPAQRLTRIGGVPAGFGPEDIPRHRGRKLVHAFTLDLREVPELAARHPGARTLSFWVQGYCEDARREQALVPRTDAQVAAIPASGGDGLELVRLTVPVALFAGAGERARYALGLLRTKPGHLFGGPVWLQDGPMGADPKFLAQFDERVARGANFGDMGVCYSFEDEATWQCL